jgi:hypothetical protein
LHFLRVIAIVIPFFQYLQARDFPWSMVSERISFRFPQKLSLCVRNQYRLSSMQQSHTSTVNAVYQCNEENLRERADRQDLDNTADENELIISLLEEGHRPALS